MIKNLFKRKPSLDLVNTREADAALRLMFEIAISDGKLDSAELDIISKIELVSYWMKIKSNCISNSFSYIT